MALRMVVEVQLLTSPTNAKRNSPRLLSSARVPMKIHITARAGQEPVPSTV
jgi:hypothetical protein